MCEEVSRCVSCEYFNHVDGCTLEPPKDCIKEVLVWLKNCVLVMVWRATVYVGNQTTKDRQGYWDRSASQHIFPNQKEKRLNKRKPRPYRLKETETIFSHPPQVIFRCSPNPFSTTTHISLTLPSIGHSAKGIGQKTSAQCQVPSDREDIALHIYDISGRLVKSFSLTTNHSALTTAVSWDGRDNAGRRVKSGVYFVSLKAGEKVLTKKLILLE